MIDQPLFDILADKLVENHGASGIVIVAYSRGSAPRGFPKAVERLVRRGIPVVVASRCQESIAPDLRRRERR